MIEGCEDKGVVSYGYIDAHAKGRLDCLSVKHSNEIDTIA
jgi:hypothetical protein